MANRWFVLALLFVTRISLGFQFQTMGSVSDEVIRELDLNYAEIGSLIEALYGTGPVFGYSCRFGWKVFFR